MIPLMCFGAPYNNIFYYNIDLHNSKCGRGYVTLEKLAARYKEKNENTVDLPNNEVAKSHRKDSLYKNFTI